MALLIRKAGDVAKRSLWQRIKDVALTDVTVIARGGVSKGSLEQIEEILLQADFGVLVTLRLVDEVSRAGATWSHQDRGGVPRGASARDRAGTSRGARRPGVDRSTGRSHCNSGGRGKWGR